MKIIEKTLAVARRYWRLLFSMNLVMLGLGALVLSHWIAQNSVLNLFLSSLSALFAAVDAWLVICLVSYIVHYSRFLQNKQRTTMLGLTIGTFYNAAYVVISFFTGVLLNSAWYMIYAVYHLVFALVKNGLGRDFRKRDTKEDSWASYSYVGYIMILAALIFYIMVIFVSNQDDKLHVQCPMLIYVIALATFINAITAIVNLLRFRKNPSPRMKTSKMINFASSLFSIFFLQTMMMKQFSDESQQDYYHLMTTVVGAIILVILLGLGIFLTWKAHRARKKS